MDKKISEKKFSENLKIYIVKPFEKYGYKKYKAKNIARVAEGEILQLVNFQLDDSKEQFTVNITSRPLYVKNDFLTLEPGINLSNFKSNKNFWWSFSLDNEAVLSFQEVKMLIETHVFPFFEATSNTKLFIQTIENSNYTAFFHWASECWKYYDISLVYLRNKEYNKAVMYLKKCHTFLHPNVTSSLKIEWQLKLYDECLALIQLIENEMYEQIDTILDDNQSNSIINLGLEKIT